MTIDVLNALTNVDVDACEPKPRSLAVSSTESLPRSSVRRSLFGRVDHNESMEFLKKELDAISRNQMQRWNFDFVDEKPVNDDDSTGHYEWTAVQPDESVPKCYALSRLPYLRRNTVARISSRSRGHEDDDDDDDDDSLSCRSSYEQTVVDRLCRDRDINLIDQINIECKLCDRVTSSLSLPKTKLTQTSIDDFMAAKKRPAVYHKLYESRRFDDRHVDSGNDDDGGGHSDDTGSKSTIRQFSGDGAKLRGCNNKAAGTTGTRYHRRPQIQESSNKRLRLSPRR